LCEQVDAGPPDVADRLRIRTRRRWVSNPHVNSAPASPCLQLHGPIPLLPN
jgi:hypothetical protein